MSQSKRIAILMLGGARRVSLAEHLIADGRRMGYDVEIFSYELNAEVPIASVGKIVIGRRWKDADVVDHLVQTIREHRIDIVLPFVDGAISIASECKRQLPEVFIPVSPEEIAVAMYDKALAAEMFAQAGIAIPTTYNTEQCSYPAIAKPRFGSASKGITVLENESQLLELSRPEDYLIQEYIRHRKEYTVDCYVSQAGEPLYIVPRLRIDVVGGEVAQTRTCRIEQLIESSRDIIKAIPFRGPITIQFIRDLDNDRYLLMEINPRLGGGVVCSMHAGAPLSEYLFKESKGFGVEECKDWKDNLFITRYFKEVVFHGK